MRNICVLTCALSLTLLPSLLHGLSIKAFEPHNVVSETKNAYKDGDPITSKLHKVQLPNLETNQEDESLPATGPSDHPKSDGPHPSSYSMNPIPIDSEDASRHHLEDDKENLVTKPNDIGIPTSVEDHIPPSFAKMSVSKNLQTNTFETHLEESYTSLAEPSSRADSETTSFSSSSVKISGSPISKSLTSSPKADFTTTDESGELSPQISTTEAVHQDISSEALTDPCSECTRNPTVATPLIIKMSPEESQEVSAFTIVEVTSTVSETSSLNGNSISPGDTPSATTLQLGATEENIRFGISPKVIKHDSTVPLETKESYSTDIYGTTENFSNQTTTTSEKQTENVADHSHDNVIRVQSEQLMLVEKTEPPTTSEFLTDSGLPADLDINESSMTDASLRGPSTTLDGELSFKYSAQTPHFTEPKMSEDSSGKTPDIEVSTPQEVDMSTLSVRASSEETHQDIVVDTNQPSSFSIGTTLSPTDEADLLHQTKVNDISVSSDFTSTTQNVPRTVVSTIQATEFSSPMEAGAKLPDVTSSESTQEHLEESRKAASVTNEMRQDSSEVGGLPEHSRSVTTFDISEATTIADRQIYTSAMPIDWTDEVREYSEMVSAMKPMDSVEIGPSDSAIRNKVDESISTTLASYLEDNRGRDFGTSTSKEQYMTRTYGTGSSSFMVQTADESGLFTTTAGSNTYSSFVRDPLIPLMTSEAGPSTSTGDDSIDISSTSTIKAEETSIAEEGVTSSTEMDVATASVSSSGIVTTNLHEPRISDSNRIVSIEAMSTDPSLQNRINLTEQTSTDKTKNPSEKTELSKLPTLTTDVVTRNYYSLLSTEATYTESSSEVIVADSSSLLLDAESRNTEQFADVTTSTESAELQTTLTSEEQKALTSKSKITELSMEDLLDTQMKIDSSSASTLQSEVHESIQQSTSTTYNSTPTAVTSNVNSTYYRPVTSESMSSLLPDTSLQYIVKTAAENASEIMTDTTRYDLTSSAIETQKNITNTSARDVTYIPSNTDSSTTKSFGEKSHDPIEPQDPTHTTVDVSSTLETLTNGVSGISSPFDEMQGQNGMITKMSTEIIQSYDRVTLDRTSSVIWVTETPIQLSSKGASSQVHSTEVTALSTEECCAKTLPTMFISDHKLIEPSQNKIQSEYYEVETSTTDPYITQTLKQEKATIENQERHVSDFVGDERYSAKILTSTEFIQTHPIPDLAIIEGNTEVQTDDRTSSSPSSSETKMEFSDTEIRTSYTETRIKHPWNKKLKYPTNSGKEFKPPIRKYPEHEVGPHSPISMDQNNRHMIFSRGLTVGLIILAVLIVITFIGVILFFVWIRQNKKASKSMVIDRFEAPLQGHLRTSPPESIHVQNIVENRMLQRRNRLAQLAAKSASASGTYDNPKRRRRQERQLRARLLAQDALLHNMTYQNRNCPVQCIGNELKCAESGFYEPVTLIGFHRKRYSQDSGLGVNCRKASPQIHHCCSPKGGSVRHHPGVHQNDGSGSEEMGFKDIVLNGTNSRASSTCNQKTNWKFIDET